MVLKPDSTVRVQPVVVGERVDSLWVIDRGLQPGQLVIVEGTQNARDGMKVAARPYGPSTAADSQRAARISRAPAAAGPPRTSSRP